MAYDPQEDFQRLMQAATREQAMLREKTARSARAIEEEDGAGSPSGGRKQQGGRGAGAERKPAEDKPASPFSKSITDAIHSGESGYKGASAIPMDRPASAGGKDAVGLASSMLGMNETQHTSALMDYLRKGGNNLNPSQLAWCAAFVGSSLGQSGMKGTGSNVATSYMGWGNAVDPTTGIQRNDVVVFPHGHKQGETGGHVGFATGRVDGDRMEVISGNQGNQVTTTWEPISSAVIRRGDNPGAPVADHASQSGMTAAPAPAPQGGDLPAGMRNNNPGNIKWFDGADRRYEGAVRPSVNTDQGDPQIVFRSHDDGMRAAASLATSKFDKGYDTIDKLIAGQGGWTPGNHAAAANIARSMNIGPNDRIDLRDPKQMTSFLHGLTTQEHGSAGTSFYTPEKINSMLGASPQQAIRVDEKALPPNARSYMDAADVRGNPREGQTVNIADLEASDMARKPKGDVSAQKWKDPGAAENAERNPQRPDVPLPPERPRTFADKRGWSDPGAAENAGHRRPADVPLPPPGRPAIPVDAPLPPRRPDAMVDKRGWSDPAAAENAMRAPPQPDVPTPPRRPEGLGQTDVPLPPERPADLLKSQQPEGPLMADYQRPQKAPDGPALADYQRPQKTADGPAAPKESAIPTPPERPKDLGAAPPAAAPTAQPAQQPVWDALYGYTTPPAQGQTAQQPAADQSSGFGEWLSGLFSNPENLSESAHASAAADTGDAGGGAGGGSFFNDIGNFFTSLGFANGGAVQSFASGGVVGKAGVRGRPDRVAPSQPGVAIPPADRGTGPGGGYNARVATTPGYALGGPVNKREQEAAPAPAEAPQPEQPEVAAPQPQETALNYTPPTDVEPVYAPGSEEMKLRDYAQRRQIARQERDDTARDHNSYTFGGLLKQALHDAVTGVSQDYGLDRAQGYQHGAVPTQESGSFLDDIAKFFSGDTGEAASPETMQKVGEMVDPHAKLNEGMRASAGLVAGYEAALRTGDMQSAQQLARSIIFHQRALAARYGEEAMSWLGKGDTANAVKALEKGASQIPDGTNVKATPIPGGAEVTKTDAHGNVIQRMRATEEQLLAAATGLKDGTMYWSQLADAASGKFLPAEKPDPAYEKYQSSPIEAIPTLDPKSPDYAAQKRIHDSVGDPPQLPPEFRQMSKENQQKVRQEYLARLQDWKSRVATVTTNLRNEQQNANREDNQQHQDDSREDSQKFSQEQQGRTFAHNDGKPLTPGAMATVDKELTPYMDSFFEQNGMTDDKDPRVSNSKGAIRSIATQILGPAKNNIAPDEAIRSAAIISSPKAKITTDETAGTMTLPNGVTLRVTPEIIQMRKKIETPTAAPAPVKQGGSYQPFSGL